MWSNLAALRDLALREVARDQTGRVKKLEIIRRQGGGRPALPGILPGFTVGDDVSGVDSTIDFKSQAHECDYRSPSGPKRACSDRRFPMRQVIQSVVTKRPARGSPTKFGLMPVV
jgi:hypothetical protein